MGSILGFVIILCVVILGILIVMFAVVRRDITKRAESILLKFQNKNILAVSSSVNYFGRESLGMKQVRGNGILVLTNNELYYQMLLPRKELSIPVDHIIGIEDPVSFLGKSRSKPLLKVYFNTEKGTDSAAWLLENVNQWKSLLEELIDKPADQL